MQTHNRSDLSNTASPSSGDAASGKPIVHDKDGFTQRVWRFTNGQGSILCHYMAFAESGGIVGHSNPNERQWTPSGNGFALLREDGSASCALAPDGPGRFSGVLDENPNIQHIVTEIEPEYPLGIRWTSGCEDRLAELQIYLRHIRRIRGLHAPDSLVWFERRCLVERSATMPEGQFWSMGAHSYCDRTFDGVAETGRYCSIARDCAVMGDAHPTNWVTSNPMTYFSAGAGDGVRVPDEPVAKIPFRRASEPIRLGHDVWVGQGVMFKGGLTIGDGCVVAARSVVTKDLPPYSIVGGVPALLIRPRFEPDIVARMQRLRWWDYPPSSLPTCWDRPAEFLDRLETAIENGEAVPIESMSVDLGKMLLRTSLGLEP